MIRRSTPVEPYEEITRRGGDRAMRELGKFFMKDNPVYHTLYSISAKLKELNIDHAVAGGMALNAHGFTRATTDVDILVTSEGLSQIHAELEGLGYVPPFAGSKNLRDVETGVRIEFLISGQFPGDGKPKPVAFPIPGEVSVEIQGIRYIGLSTLIELKLTSGMTNPGRLKDLGDVQELIRTLRLDRAFAKQLNPYIQAKYFELWDGVAAGGSQEE